MKMSFNDVVAILMVAFFVFLIGFLTGRWEGYKKGQIDAIKGTIKFEVQTNADKTTTWEEIK